MSHRSARRQRIAAAVRAVEHTIASKYARAEREEFAESRKREGWDEALVEQAVAAGPLEGVRAAIREERHEAPKILTQAMHALGILDAGRRVETVYPHYGDDTSSLQRRTYAPPRLREE